MESLRNRFDFKNFISAIESVKSYLCAKLEEVEMDLCDILHYIDFKKLNACQDWAATEIKKHGNSKERLKMLCI